MTALETFRDYARAMATRVRDPRDDNPGFRSPECQWFRNYETWEPQHPRCQWDQCACNCHPRDVPSDRERALWTQLADEIDTYLHPTQTDDTPLFT